jgi:hypothetical protein
MAAIRAAVEAQSSWLFNRRIVLNSWADLMNH